MKNHRWKTGLYLFAFLITVNAFSQSKRIQLMEYFDNNSIPPFGKAANHVFDSIAYVNSSKIAVIKYHVSWGSKFNTDSMNLHNAKQVTDRVIFYGIKFDPWILQDGGNVNLHLYNDKAQLLTQSYINNRDTVTSPFTVSASHTLNAAHDIIQTHTVVKKTGNASGAYVVHVVVIEKLVHFDSPPGVSGDVNFLNVMKKMLPSSHGTVLKSLNTGDSMVLDLDWPLAHVYDISQLDVISFVQDTSTLEVVQASPSEITLPAGIKPVSNSLNSFNVYPNPITESSVIEYSISSKSDIIFSIWDLAGRKILDLPQGMQQPGVHIVNINTERFNLKAGLYMIKFSDPQFTVNKYMLKL